MAGSGPDGAAVAGEVLLGLWGRWMRAGGATEKTISTRLDGIRSLATHSGVRDVTGFAPGHVVGWLADCRSQWTRCTYAVSARQWHRWLVDQGVRPDDPTARVPKPREPRGVPRPVTDQALDDVLAIAGRRARAYILLAAYAGLRVHEIAQVRGDDFDAPPGQDGWLYVTGKGDVAAALPVHELVDQLRNGWPASGYWFPGADHGHIRAVSISTTVAATFRRAGHRFTAHQLRHWYGTQIQRLTGDIRVTQELLRHASPASTAIYTQVSSPAKIAAVRRLGTAGGAVQR